MIRAALLVAALAFAPLAHADDDTCKVALGRGWPPATENYGSTVEKLFAGGQTPAWSFTLLPKNGVESGVLLIANAEGGDWTLRRAVADERVHYWGPTNLELRTTRAPNIQEVSIPATVASRFLSEWRDVLSAVAPEGSTAPFSDGDAWLFVAGDPGSSPGQALRVSGLEPRCEVGKLLRKQIDLLIEASDEDEEKREKRWRQLGELLDRTRVALGKLAPAAP